MKEVIRKYFLKPVFSQLKRMSPHFAKWMKNNIYKGYLEMWAKKDICDGCWEREKDMPYIFFDTSVISENNIKTGIQRVVDNVFLQMNRFLPALMSVRIINKELMTSYAYLNASGLNKKEFERRIVYKKNDKLLLIDSSWNYTDEMRDIVRNFHEIGGRTGGVIYDLFPLLHPEWFPPALILDDFAAWHNMMLEECDDVLCISRTVADSVAEYFVDKGIKRNEPLKLHYFPMGADIQEVSGEIRDELRNFMRENNVFLMVGTVEVRKGYDIAARALEKMLESGYDVKILVIGKDGWGNNKAKELFKKMKRNGKLLWLQDASDYELQWSYENSQALIAASQDEGYGLPLIEAAYFGLPIMASNIPVFHEVTAENADFFRKMDVDDLCQVWQKWLTTKEHPDSKKIEIRSWDDSAKTVAEIMEGKSVPYKVLL